MNTSAPLSTVGWYWHRLRAMDPAEIASRFREKALQWTDQSASRVLDTYRLAAPDRTSMPLPVRSRASDAIRDSVGRNAEMLRQGRWSLFGWREVMMDRPPRWHWDALRGVELPQDIESRALDHRHLPGAADCRVIWEINRWAEMVVLAQNAWLEQKPDDAKLAQSWLADWCKQNPTGFGINWCSPLEAALRLINFCWIDALLRDCGDAAVASAQQDLAQKIVPAHTWWIWRHHSFGSSANNHLLGELAALVLAARRWPCLARIACSAERAWELLTPEVLRQFSVDGGNREQALHYHLFAWEIVWQAARAMDALAGPVASRLQLAAQFFIHMEHGSEPWDFGDSDDAQVTPLAAGREGAATEWKAWMERRAEGESIRYWLGAPPAAMADDSVGGWREFPTSGLAVCGTDNWKVRVDGSPLGFGSMAAHGHLDAMHVSIWHGSHALVVDPGTGAYGGDPALRARLASWEFHNGPLPARGRSCPKRMGPFLWSDHHDVPLLELADDACSVSFACDGPMVKRTVRHIPSGDAWEIKDEVVTDLPHVVRWRLAPDWTVASEDQTGAHFRHASGKVVSLAIDSPWLEAMEISKGELSPRFGERSSGPVVIIRFKRSLTCRWRAP